jgi:hypothetical protein
MMVSPAELHSEPVDPVCRRMEIIVADLLVDPDQDIKNRGQCDNKTGNIDDLVKGVPPERPKDIVKDQPEHTA